MRRALGLLVVAAWSGCSGALPAQQHDVDAGTDSLPTSCVADEQCPAGMVCEGCVLGDKTCVPGCRVDAQCPANMVCSGKVLCTECPCPPGWCDLDPCRDVDGDGFVPTDDAAASCPGKQKGDCDDARAWIHPGAREVCATGLDEDCDGKTDARDDECRVCGSGQSSCSTSRNCGLGWTCERGCCETCAVPPQAVCDAGQCSLPGGVDPDTGCQRAPVCGACDACPSTRSPVCGFNGATYDNACLATAAGTQVLYAGECLSGEQTSCRANAFDCLGNQYCRGADAGVGLCTKLGHCAVDVDCAEAVRATVLCPNGSVAALACRDLRCAAVCP